MYKAFRDTGINRNFRAYLVFLLFDILLLLPLLQGRALYWGDILLYFEPMHHFEREMLLQGQIPLWNPYLLGGQPFVGNPQMWVFFPTTPLLAYVPAWLYLNIVCFVSILLCGIFFYHFLFRWTRSGWASLMGGMTYMGSACIIARLQFPPMVMSAPFCPLLLLLIDKQLDAPHIKNCVIIALTVGLLVLAAHPQMAYFILGIGTVYTLLRLWDFASLQEPEQIVKWWMRSLFPLVLALLWGVALSAVQVLPVLQLTRESPRVEMDVKEANRFYLEPKHLLTLILPHYWGHPATSDFRERGNAWEPALFIGWLPILFIGVAIKSFRKRRVVAFWFVVAAVSMWLAFGMHGGLFWLAFYYLPGLSRFHDPARFLYLTTVAFAFLTGIGAKAFVEKSKFIKGAVLACCVAIPLIAYSPEWNPTIPYQQLDYVPQIAQTHLNRGGRLYIPHYVNLWRRYVNYNDYGRNDRRTMQAFMNTLIPNIGMRYGTEMVYGYEPVPVAAPLILEGLITLELDRGEPIATRLMSLLNGTTLIQVTEEDVFNARLKHLTTQGGMKAYHNRDSLGEAWLVRSVRRVEGRRRILATLTDPAFNPALEAVVTLGDDGKPVAELEALEGSAVTNSPTNTVKSEQRKTDRLVFTVDSGDKPSFLVASLAAYPGWKADCDGTPLRLYRTDRAIFGMAIPEGRHTVTLTYQPAAFRIGLFISLLALGGILGSVGFLWFSREQNKPKILKADLERHNEE